MIPKITVEMIQNAREQINKVFKLHNTELSIILKGQHQLRGIINYALDRLNGEIIDQTIKTNCEIAGEVYDRAFIQPLSEGEHRYVTISNGDIVKLTVDDHGELRKDGITKKCKPENECYDKTGPIPAKDISEWEGWKRHDHIEEETGKVSKEEYDLNDKRKRERIEEEMKKEYDHEERIGELAKSCRETQNNVYQNIKNRSFKGEEPELNEEAISKLCDDLIEAKKKPLSAAQIIDKYARRD